MQIFPAEILNNIFLYLNQQDIVECMSVCRFWKDSIKYLGFCTTLCLHKKEQLLRVVKKMHQEPQISHTIERLIIESLNIRSSDLYILPSLFPNIRDLTFRHNYDDVKGTFQEVQYFHPWKKTIKSIIMFSSHFLASHILCGSICPSLTEIQTLCINKSDTKELIELLKNAPNLKILTLWKGDFNLEKFEVLHENVPLLKSLSLNNCHIYSSILPIVIKPANCMKKLKLKYISAVTTENYINFQRYLTKKYPCIEDLVFKVDIPEESVQEGFDQEEYEQEESNLGLGRSSEFSLQIQQIGSYLTSLEYEDNKATNFIFSILDKSDCKIKKVTIEEKLNCSDLQDIVQSNQAQYIQSLSCCISAHSMITKKIKQLTALTELKLCYAIPDTPIPTNFNNLIGAVGDNLETLELKDAIVSLGVSSLPVFSTLKKMMPLISSYPRLKKLTFTGCMMLPTVDFFISHAFPNLRELVVDDCDLSVIPEFNIGDLDLSKMIIKTPLLQNKNHILIKTTGNNKKRWYTAKRVSEMNLNTTTDSNNYPTVKSLPFEKYDGEPYKTFVVKSLRNFLLVNIPSLINDNL